MKDLDQGILDSNDLREGSRRKLYKFAWFPVVLTSGKKIWLSSYKVYQIYLNKEWVTVKKK